MAIPAYEDAGTGAAGNSAGTFSVPYPATVNSGDLLILHFYGWTTGSWTPAMDTPSGWTLLYDDDFNPTGSYLATSCVYAKIADGDETGSLDVNIQTNQFGTPHAARIYRFSGSFGGSFSEAGSLNTDTAATISHADVTTTAADRLVVAFVGVSDNNTVGAWTGETGGTWTLQENYLTTLSNDAALALSTAPLASSGTISGGSGTGGDPNGWSVRAFAIFEGSGSTTYTATASADAALTALGLTRTAVLDAVLQLAGATNTATASVDAALAAVGLTRSVFLDAVVEFASTRTADVDAVVQRYGIARTTLIDAALRAAATRATSLDARIELATAAVTRQASLDALLMSVGLERQTALDSVVRLLRASQASLDAAIAAEFSSVSDIDAALAVVYGLSVGLDARVEDRTKYLQTDADAAVLRRAAVTLGVNALILSSAAVPVPPKQRILVLPERRRRRVARQ